MDIRDFMVRTIEATEHPLAPIVLQDAHASASRLAKMLSSKGDQAEALLIGKKLFSAWSDDELNHVCIQTNFLIAVCSALTTAIECYVAALPKSGQGTT